MPSARALLPVLLGVAAFAATATWAGRELPPFLHITTLKRLHFEEHAAEYTAVAIGSSRVYREFVPPVFERRMERLGAPQKLFDFGAPGMELPEQVAVLEAVLAADPPDLQWVFVELHDVELEVDERNFLADRQVSWHDLPTTSMTLEAVLDSDLSPGEKLVQVGLHTRLLLRHEAGVGRARILVPGLVDGDVTLDGWRDAEFLQDRQGWLPLEAETGALYADRRRLLLEDVGHFGSMVDALRDELARFAADPDDPSLPRLDALDRACVARLVELMEGRDARLVFVVMPQLRGQTAFLRAHAEGLVPDLLAFNDPDRFPELYDVDGWFDRTHLGRRLARRFTELFVDELDRVVGVAAR